MDKKLFDYELEEMMDITLLIKSADIRKTKTDKDYIAFTFQDKSGQIDAKLWGATPEQIKTLIVGKVVRLSGFRELYNNVPQIKILSIKLVEEASVLDYIQQAPIDIKTIEQEIMDALCLITDENMYKIVHFIYEKYCQAFYEYPAAKRHHHAFIGGLSFHTLSMIRLAKNICAQYPVLNRSLLISGIMLHDIGKVIELSGPIGTEYTLSGNLIGHIVLMSDEITKACVSLKIDDMSESVILLKHIVLAHHGKLEYGSPVVPQIVEAEILHHIDLIDAKLNMLESTLNKTNEQTFSEKIFGLDNRSFYKHTLQ